MNQSKSSAGEPAKRTSRQFAWVLFCLLALLIFLFRNGLVAGHTVFSNDGPLGAISAQCARLPAGFFGYWQDLNWLGGSGPSASPDLTQGLALVCGPLIFSKIYALFSLLFLGLSAWLCFRQWEFSPAACLLGAVAASLNSDFFSTACWGVASQPLSFGCDFLALAALADETSPKRWVRVMLAGFAVGLGVMEAFDIGAIFSLVIAAFVVFQALASEKPIAQRVVAGVVRVALVAGFAAFIAISAVSSLVGTQIKGVAGMGQDAASKAQRWGEATQWSLPKRETLSLFVPGLFGFRMDTREGGNYWGAGGRDVAWDRYFSGGPLQEGEIIRITSEASSNLNTAAQVDGSGNIVLPDLGAFKAVGKTPETLQQEIVKSHPALDNKGLKVARERPQGFIRYGGGGIYAGVLVVLIAVWTVFQSFRKEQSVFRTTERKFIWFWSGVAFLCLLIGFGRFAPFYRLFYALPFASTMRNPSKFIHVVEWILVILFAYGVNGLYRRFAETPMPASGLSAYLKAWWKKAAAFDRNWVKASALALVLAVVAWLIYSSSREQLVAYLQQVDFGLEMAGAIASFSIAQVGWFLLFLALALGLVALVSSGYFSGKRARIGAILLGLLLVGDLVRANVPWVVTWNWERKYASNQVIDLLREKPYEHRVALLPFSPPQQVALFNDLYNIEWKQQLFQYYNIQSLDIVMMPRAPVEYLAWENALFFNRTTNTLHRVTRRWELTNTRYLLGAAGFLNVLNQQIDPVQHRFRIAVRFDVVPKPGISNPTGLDELTAVINPEGQYALFDFTGALPRAKLYTNWQVSTNDQATLDTLTSEDFHPEQTVLVADPSVPASPAVTNASPQPPVEFTSYAPKRIVLVAKPTSPAVLLLNDKYDPNWKLWVNGKPAPLLRCNYLMRGVYLQPGTHTVDFRFEPPIGTLYVSIAAVAVGLLLLGYLAFAPRKDQAPGPAESSVHQKR